MDPYSTPNHEHTLFLPDQKQRVEYLLHCTAGTLYHCESFAIMTRIYQQADNSATHTHSVHIQ